MCSVKHCCFCPKTQKKKQLCNCFSGEPGGIRTHDLLILWQSWRQIWMPTAFLRRFSIWITPNLKNFWKNDASWWLKKFVSIMSCCYSTQIAKSTGDCQKVNHPCFCYQIIWKCFSTPISAASFFGGHFWIYEFAQIIILADLYSALAFHLQDIQIGDFQVVPFPNACRNSLRVSLGFVRSSVQHTKSRLIPMVSSGCCWGKSITVSM